MKAQGAGGTAVAEQTTSRPAEADHGYGAPPSLEGSPQPRGTAEEPAAAATPPAEPKPPGTRRPILEALELPEEVLEQVKKRRGEPMAPPAGEETEESPPAAEAPEQTPGEEPGQGEQPEEAGEPQAAEAPPVAAEAEQPIDDTWSPTAKARVKDEAEKRRRANKERDEWKAKALEANAQLQAAAPGAQPIEPTMLDPLADVIDGPSFDRAEKKMWDWLEFAEKNPDGADDVLIGQRADGSEIRRDYPRDEVIEMKLVAQRALASNGGLARKAQYLQEVDKSAKVAKEQLPELFSQEPNEVNRLADQLMRELPIQLRACKNWPLYLADVVAGEMKRRAVKNGQVATTSGKPLSKSAAAILGAPKVPVAPGAPKTRAAVPKGSRDEVDKARQAHVDSGFSSETLERWIAAKRRAASPGSASRAPALV